MRARSGIGSPTPGSLTRPRRSRNQLKNPANSQTGSASAENTPTGRPELPVPKPLCGARLHASMAWLVGSWLALGVGCSRTEREVRALSSPPAPAPAATSAAPGVASDVASDGHVLIPAGSFNAGTEPGRDERHPELEPRLERVALGPFEIDARPYPGAGAPALGFSRSRAREACAARSGRLCTELEWERACKGPDSQRFASGGELNAACAASPEGCRSAFGVWGLGSAPEWTASDVTSGADPLAAIRGPEAARTPASQRCAHRSALSPEPAASALAFRCCYGAPNAARLQIPALGPTFDELQLPVPRLAELLRADPLSARLAQDLEYFPQPSGAAAVLAKGSGDRQGFSFTTLPLLWNPVRGASFLVVSARSAERTSFVLVFHVLGEDQYRLASSFIMAGEPGPIALAYNGYIRPRLHFSSCWGCPGETGKILYREPDSAVILQP